MRHGPSSKLCTHVTLLLLLPELQFANQVRPERSVAGKLNSQQHRVLGWRSEELMRS